MRTGRIIRITCQPGGCPMPLPGFIRQPNPHHLGACPSCGAWRSDGRPPYNHAEGCADRAPDQARIMRELRTGDHEGPVIYCDKHEHWLRLPGYADRHGEEFVSAAGRVSAPGWWRAYRAAAAARGT